MERVLIMFINPLNPMLAVTGHDELWPFFHLASHTMLVHKSKFAKFGRKL